MLENELHELVRTTLLAGLADRPGFTDVAVKRLFQPSTVGVPSGPTIFVQTIGRRRVGWLKRIDIPPVAPATDFTHRETQWWETTFQVGGLARRKPTEITLPSSVDIVSAASDILQSDSGLKALGAQRVRPLRITNIRNLYITNDSDQYEANPSFDIVLSHVQIIDSTTPPVADIVPIIGRV